MIDVDFLSLQFEVAVVRFVFWPAGEIPMRARPIFATLPFAHGAEVCLTTI